MLIILTMIVFQFQLLSSNLNHTIHVAKTGIDTNDGSQKSPLLTINAASKIALPGDLILVHEGIYREWVKPLRGGTGEDKRITYRAAPGENVSIKGSESITNWIKVSPGVWMAELPNTFFGDYNPTPFLRYIPINQANEVYKIVVEDFAGAPGMQSDYNLFLEGAGISGFGDFNSVVDPYKTGFNVEERSSGVTIQFSINNSYKKVKGPFVDAKLVGVFSTTGQSIEDQYGKSITVKRDISGKEFIKPVVGPLSDLAEGLNIISWNLKQMK